jgi:hypothetical protein
MMWRGTSFSNTGSSVEGNGGSAEMSGALEVKHNKINKM